ncbi:hypothetical protein FDI24_gp200 [Acidovorax phage ACP17]|uniref:Uncharacterized protein n=1 Tax=Acidovorax phage ACP17 TaxID=2010329 RepID=A0A218M372_9CAUD|nr:hypothetical protein FDI24_gp200 [Acidovorax phage ACP17]ASD50481.1 hypothetical protein [Acidovorax phage ACP17]
MKRYSYTEFAQKLADVRLEWFNGLAKTPQEEKILKQAHAELTKACREASDYIVATKMKKTDALMYLAGLSADAWALHKDKLVVMGWGTAQMTQGKVKPEHWAVKELFERAQNILQP